MILRRNFHFLSFNTNPRFSPLLLYMYVRCKSGVTFVRRCFRDGSLNFSSFSNARYMYVPILTRTNPKRFFYSHDSGKKKNDSTRILNHLDSFLPVFEKLLRLTFGEEYIFNTNISLLKDRILIRGQNLPDSKIHCSPIMLDICRNRFFILLWFHKSVMSLQVCETCFRDKNFADVFPFHKCVNNCV